VRRTTLAAAALIPACALALSACGSNGASSASGTAAGVTTQNNAGLTQAQLLDHLKSALATATSVRMKGTIDDSGNSIGIDVQINKSGTAQGTMSSNGAQIPLIAVNGTIYIQLTASYISTLKSALPAGVVGKWIKEPTGGSDAQSMSDLTNWNQLTAKWIAASGDTFTYLDTATLDGRQVADYTDVSVVSGTKSTGVLSVPLTGAALPIQVAEKSGVTGTAVYTWSQPTTVTAPPASEILTLPSTSA
jgi:hypothetical protein